MLKNPLNLKKPLFKTLKWFNTKLNFNNLTKQRETNFEISNAIDFSRNECPQNNNKRILDWNRSPRIAIYGPNFKNILKLWRNNISNRKKKPKPRIKSRAYFNISPNLQRIGFYLHSTGRNLFSPSSQTMGKRSQCNGMQKWLKIRILPNDFLSTISNWLISNSNWNLFVRKCH